MTLCIAVGSPTLPGRSPRKAYSSEASKGPELRPHPAEVVTVVEDIGPKASDKMPERAISNSSRKLVSELTSDASSSL